MYLIDKYKLIEAMNNPPYTMFTGYMLVQWYAECLAMAPKENEWIKCSDRMPKPNENVLAICGGRRVIGLYDPIKNRFDLDTGYYELDKFTHWQPLPDYPDDWEGYTDG